MKRKRKWWLLTLVPAGVVLLLPLLRGGPDNGVELQTTTAEIGTLEERADGTGMLEGLSRVDISAETGGLIEHIHVQEGDTVQAGQLLLELETTQARANLNTAASQIETATIALSQAERELERITELNGRGLSSHEELLVTRETRELRRQELNRAYFSYSIAENSLEKTSYLSPSGGIVTALNVEEGEMAVQGTMNNAGTVLLTIEDMSAFLVRVTMVESEIVSVREGMEAEVVLDALPEDTFTGVVEEVGLSASSDGGGETAAEFEVLVRLNSVHPAMRSGMSASVEIVTARSENCVRVPVQSIVERPHPQDPSRTVPSVLVLMDDGTIKSVPVTTGISSVMEIEVTGIEPGERVVSGPVESLRALQSGDTLERNTDGIGDEDGRAQGGPMPFGGPPPGAGGGR